jgi:porin
VPSGWGINFSASRYINENLFPFVRFGDSGGGVAAEQSFSAGWAKPSEDTFGPGLDDETVLETSYKFQISRELSLLADGQVIFHPANNPGKNSIWVFGVRAMLIL